MFPFLSDDVKIDRVVDATAAGTTDVNGTGLSMAGYDGIMFIALLGTLTATQVTALHAQQSSDDGSADAYTDIEGSATDPLGDDDDNDMLVLDIFRPQEAYVRPVVDRATANAVIDGVIAIRYKATNRPVVQGARVIEHVKIADPVAGTA
jgi:hypothetical protein